MANWEDWRIMDVIEKIQKEEIVLPVVQRVGCTPKSRHQVKK